MLTNSCSDPRSVTRDAPRSVIWYPGCEFPPLDEPIRHVHTPAKTPSSMCGTCQGKRGDSCMVFTLYAYVCHMNLNSELLVSSNVRAAYVTTSSSNFRHELNLNST
jgi:hypothetical protein